MQKSTAVSLIRFLAVVAVIGFFGFFNGPSTAPVALRSGHVQDGEDVCNPREVDDPCAYIRKTEACLEITARFNYLDFYYCTLKPHNLNVVFYLVYGLWLLLLFSLLSGTAEKYFCPILEELVETFHMSSDLAGISLLSLGNSGPDIASQFASLDSEQSLAFASVLGAGILVCCLVSGLVIIVSRPGHLTNSIESFPFIRNSLFYLCSLLYMAVVMYTGRISLVTALVFPLIYVVFVVVVVVFASKSEAVATENDEKESKKLLVNDDYEYNLNDELLDGFFRKPTKLFKYLFPASDWDEKSTFEKILYVFESPLTLLRNLSIASIDFKETPQKFFVCSVPLCFPIVLFFSIGLFESYIWMYCYAPFVLYFTWTLYDTKQRDHPRPRVLWISLGFIGSILWLYLSAEELVALLRTLGVVFNISPSILGITVLAFGNSAADMVSNIHVSKKDPNIAMGASIGGPLLNLLLGTGSAFVVACVKGPIAIELTNSVVWTVVSIIFSMVFILISVCASRYKPPKAVGYMFLAVYFIYVVGAIIFEFI
ncbi:hypothetical protein RCL1_000505 [Eukaryota sp. TZLM3-RCL]